MQNEEEMATSAHYLLKTVLFAIITHGLNAQMDSPAMAPPERTNEFADMSHLKTYLSDVIKFYSSSGRTR